MQGRPTNRWGVAAFVTPLLFALSGSTALGHGGGLDANGCHTNRKTGEYHCHGQPRSSPRSEQAPPANRREATPQALFSPPQAATGETSPALSPCALTSEQDLITTTQLLLKRLGLGAGMAANGVLNPDTVAAIKAFQRRAGMREDGRISGRLLVALSLEVATAR